MEYAVNLSDRAERDLDELFRYLDAANSNAARKWFNGLENAIGKLARFPRRGSRASEGRKIGRSIRQLLYGGKPDVYRVLYEIDSRAKTIYVLAIRHGARDVWNPER